MVLLPNLVLVQHNPVSMGTKSLRSEDVKQLVRFDECVCLPRLVKARWERERSVVACTRLGWQILKVYFLLFVFIRSFQCFLVQHSGEEDGLL